jgi:hypothetical protein
LLSVTVAIYDQFISDGSLRPAPKSLRKRVPLWTETDCRFRPKQPAGLNRNRLPETPKYAVTSKSALFRPHAVDQYAAVDGSRSCSFEQVEVDGKQSGDPTAEMV